jgi:hypothetical protein
LGARCSKLLLVALSLDLRGSDDAAFATEGQGEARRNHVTWLRGAPPVNNRKKQASSGAPIIEIP